MNVPPQSPPPPWAWWYESGRRAGGPDLRVSDAERNAMADLLSKHYGEGRLDDEEFKERIDRAMSAKTRSDLHGLTADLPRLDSQPAPPVPRHRHRHRLGSLLGLVLVVSIVSWSLSSIFVLPHVPWVLLAIAAVVLWRYSSRHRYRDHSHSHPTPPFG